MFHLKSPHEHYGSVHNWDSYQDPPVGSMSPMGFSSDIDGSMDEPDFHDHRIVLEDGIQTLKLFLGSSGQPARVLSVTSFHNISKCGNDF